MRAYFVSRRLCGFLKLRCVSFFSTYPYGVVGMSIFHYIDGFLSYLRWKKMFYMLNRTWLN